MQFIKRLTSTFLLLTLTLTPLPQTNAQNTPFSDIPTSSPYYKIINSLKENSIIQGYNDGTFKPNQKINRAEFLKLLFENSDDLTPEFDPEQTFSDIPETAWFAKYISTAKSKGYISGYPDNTFKPSRNINYAEALKLINLRYALTEIAPSNLPPLPEPQSNQWYTEYLKNALHFNIQTIEPQISPETEITRAQSAELIFNARNVFEENRNLDDFYYSNLSVPDTNGLITTNYTPTYDLPINLYGQFQKLNINIYQTSPEFLTKKYPFYTWQKKISPSEKQSLKLIKSYTDSPTTTSTQSRNYSYGYLKLNLPKSGIYLITISPETDTTQELQFFLNFSDLNLSLVTNAYFNQNLAWITSTKNSPLNPNLKLTTHNKNNNSTKVHPIDQNGISKFSDKFDIITVQDENNFAIVDKYFYESTKTPKVHLYTDRPLYRPGETLNFKGIAREIRNNNFQIPQQKNYFLEIKTNSYATTKSLLTKSITLDQNGNFNETFKLPSELQTGTYFISISTDISGSEHLGSTTFQIEEFKKLPLDIQIINHTDTWFDNDNISSNFNISFLNGQPFANKSIDYTLTRQTGYFCRYEICPLYKSSFPAFFNETQVDSGKLQTDQNGNLTYSFTAKSDITNDFISNPDPQAIYTLNLTATDASNLPVSTSTEFYVFPANLNLEITTDSTQMTPNTPFTININSLTQTGEQLKNHPLTLNIYQQNEYYPSEEFSLTKIAFPTPTSKTLLQTTSLTTDQNGKTSYTYTPKKTGTLIIEATAKDKQNRESTNTHYIYINEENQTTYNSFLNLTTDKPTYNPTDEIKLTIKPIVPIRKTLTILSTSESLNHQISDFNGTTTKTLTFNLPETSFNQVQILTLTLNEQGFVDQNNLYLPINQTKNQIQINLNTNKNQYKPGEEVTLNIETLIRNQPQKSNLSIAVIDKGLLNLAYNNFNIFDEFYKNFYLYPTLAVEYTTRISNDTKSYDSKSKTREDYGETQAPGGSPSEEKMEKSTPMPFPEYKQTSSTRSKFENTAYWNPNVSTDSNGKAQIKFRLPDNLTTWKIIVVANSDSSYFGEAQTQIKTSKELSVLSYKPRFVNETDHVTIQYLLQNTTSSAITLNTNLNTNAEILQKPSSEITIPPNSSQLIYFKLSTPSNQTSLNLNLISTNSQTNQKLDELNETLPINPSGLTQKTIFSGSDFGTHQITAKTGSLSNIKSIKFHLSPTISESLTNSLQYLTGFPYGCVEQTMSRFLPNIVVYNLRDKLKFTKTDYPKLKEQVKSGLDRLKTLQNSDGGWGWWENDTSNPKNTAYVTYGLLISKSSGFNVDPSMLQKAISNVKSQLQNNKTPDLNHYFAYVLSLDQSTETKNFLSEQLPKIQKQPTSKIIDKLFLSIAINKQNPQAAKQLLESTLKEITENEASAYFEIKNLDYRYYESALLVNALALEATTEILPQSKFPEKLINYFNQNNFGLNYSETHALSHAVIALAKYTASTNELTPNYTYEILIGNKIYKSGKLTEAETINIPTSEITSSTPITIKKQGTGKLYYSLTTEQKIPQNLVQESSNGFQITRKYFDSNGKQLSENLPVGETIRIELTVKNSTEAHYVLIEDHLPAGIESINPNLKSDLPKTLLNTTYADHIEYLDNKTAIFRTNLPAGQHTFSYFARTATTGTFSINPAKAEMMYAPSFNGNTPANQITIINEQ